MYWKTGPAALDYASTGGQVPTSCSATGCMVSAPNPAGQLSRSSVAGTTLTSPALTGGTPARPAAIFTTGDGSARIGFTSSAGAPFSLSFLDYPIQILVGNVCVK